MKRKSIASQKTKSKPHAALLISPVAEDHEVFDELFRFEGWTLNHAESIRSASALLKESPASVVITERDLPVGNWRDVLEAVLAMPLPPLLIVVSQLADEHLWAEAINLGAYDVLAKPLDDTEVVRVLSMALNHGHDVPLASTFDVLSTH